MHPEEIRNPAPHKIVTQLLETRDRDGKLHGGYGQWYVRNGRRELIGHWNHGVKHGRWRAWDPDGRLILDATYVDGRRTITRVYIPRAATE